MKYSKEYWRGDHDCENGKQLKINETEDWRLGFLTALEDGADHQRKEEKSMEKNQNRETWVGYRPSVMLAKKKNKKHDRKEGKQICRNAIKGEKE